MAARVLMLGVLAGSVAAAPHRHTHRHSRTTITHDDGWVEPTPEDRAIADDEMADWLDPGRDPNDGQISLDNCGTDDVDGDTWDKDDVEERIANEAVENRCTEGALDCIDPERNAMLTIKTVFHVIHNGNSGKVPESVVDKQVLVMNSAFSGQACDGYSDGPSCPYGGPKNGNIQFVKHAVNFVDHAQHHSCKTWKQTIGNTYAWDSRQYMNVYICDAGGTLGWTQYPWSDDEGAKRQGVFVNFRTIPGYEPYYTGSCSFSCRYNLGYTAVHEIGHYMGLYHTFNTDGSCSSTGGDKVADTPIERSPAGGCSNGYHSDSCPQDTGQDPIWSFMDYSDDVCMQYFSDGQVDKMRSSLTTFRPQLVSNSRGAGSTADAGKVEASPPPTPAPPPASACSGKTSANFCNGRGNPVVAATANGNGQCVCQCNSGWRGGTCNAECSNRMCGAGTYRGGLCNSAQDNFLCYTCPAGKYTSVRSSATVCTQQAVTQCYKGFKLANYNSKTSAQSCEGCSDGTFQDNNNYKGGVCLNQPWRPCAKGFAYSNLNSKTEAMVCTACPQGTTTSGTSKSEGCYELNCSCEASARSSTKRGNRPVV